MKALNLTCNKLQCRNSDAAMADSITSASMLCPKSTQPTEGEYSHNRDLKCNVMVEQVNPPLEEITSVNSNFSCEESDMTTVQSTTSESNLQGYGPEFIAEETEIVAAETNIAAGTSEVFVSMDITLGNVDMNGSHCHNNSDGVTLSNVSEDCKDLEAQNQDNNVDILMNSCGRDTIVQSSGQNSLSDQTNFISEPNKDKSVNITPLVLTSDLTPGQTIAWMKREWKKARDRAKKRSKRADPLYRTKERAEALVRMRNRRSDPEYRERERARDRQRRKLARQKNLIQRQEERTRDRMYKQRRRTNLIQDSQLPQTSNVMSSEFVDAEDISQNVTDIETSRDSAILECANDLDFQVVEVYNEMEVKVEQCVEAYS